MSASLGNGTADATSAIQTAINTACANANGGAVLLPPGTYRVLLPTAGAPSALNINCSKVVLRGSGRTQTFLFFDDAARARGKAVIRVGGAGSVLDNASTTTIPLSGDLLRATRTLPVGSSSGLSVGALVAVRHEVTTAWRIDHRMDAAMTGEGDYWPSSGNLGVLYLRRVAALTSTSVTLDEPTRLPMLVRDGTRLYTRPTFISESGVEDLSIGMKQSAAAGARDDEGAFEVAGTMGYEVHGSHAVLMDLGVDLWLRRVDTYLPPGNTLAHVLSHGLTIARGGARITIDDCRIGPSGYRGGGGNGYTFQINGQDVLLVDVRAEGGRHNFTFNDATASGNVFLRAQSVNARMANDSHRFLAHQNLFDNPVQTSSWLQAVNRRNTSTGAGFTSTEAVFWRVRTVSLHPSAQQCVVETAQYGHGYVIGTSGPGRVCTSCVTNSYWGAGDVGAPTDWVEGVDAGVGLVPESLYLDQRAKRCARDNVPCAADWP